MDYENKYAKYKKKYLNLRLVGGFASDEIYAFIKSTFAHNNADDTSIKDFSEAVSEFSERIKSQYFLNRRQKIDTNLFLDLLLINPQLLNTFVEKICNIETYTDTDGNNILNLLIDQIATNKKRDNRIRYNATVDHRLTDDKIGAILDKSIRGNNIFELNKFNISPFIKVVLKKMKDFNIILKYADIKINLLEKHDLNYLVYCIYKNNSLDMDMVGQNRILILYQIANLYSRYDIVRELYDRIGNEYHAEISYYISGVNRLEQVYDPLWLYNVDQIRNSIIAMLKSAKSDIVVVPAIEPIFTIDRFSVVEIDDKRWIVKPGIDRYFGAKHLRKYGAPVAQKKLIKIGSDDTINVSININTNNFPVQQMVTIDVSNFFTLSEVIEGKLSPNLGNCVQYWKYGFFDNEKDNCAQHYNKRTNQFETIIIDTDMEKNFYDSCGRLDKFQDVTNVEACEDRAAAYKSIFSEIYDAWEYKFTIQLAMTDIGL